MTGKGKAMTYFDSQTEIRRENEEAKAPVDSMVMAPFAGIFLQWSPDVDGTDDATWCQDQINDDDTHYIRSDIYDDALQKFHAALIYILTEASHNPDDSLKDIFNEAMDFQSLPFVVNEGWKIEKKLIPKWGT
jgi:hypothetical protein